MQLVNCSNEMLQVENTISAGAANNLNLRRWLPGLFLIATLIAVSVMGKPDSPRADLDWLSRLANAGDTGAQLQLGLAYRDGLYGLTPDARTGLYWLNQAADAGNAYAEDAVGEAYAKGQGTAANADLASRWWRKAMHDGNQNARIHLSEALIQSGHLNQAKQLLM